MTEPTNDKILNRVRGLLDKAASTDSEHEAQALRDKAMELMTAYGIEQAMLEATGQKKRDEIITTKILYKNPYSREKHTLLHVIAKAYQCRAIAFTSGKSVLYADLVGHASDVERVEFLYTLLLVQAENGAAKVKADGYQGSYDYGYGSYRVLTPRQVAARSRALRVAYMAGFADEIHDRLTMIQRHAAAQNDAAHVSEGTSTALVLASRKDLVDQRYAELFPGSKKMSSRNYSATGYEAGQAGGRRADLGQNRFNGGRKALAR